MTEQPPAVDVRSLHVQFGDVEAVSGVDLTAPSSSARPGFLPQRAAFRERMAG